jgi:hypothetical protein
MEGGKSQMKIRMDFVTNSSSSNFVIFGDSKESILRMIKEYKIFGEITDRVMRYLEEKRPLEGAALKEYYDDVIMWKMTYARARALKALNEDTPFDWLYSSSTDAFISKEAGLLSEPYLERSVAFEIELEDISGEEYFGWKATGFHRDKKTNASGDMLLVIGINNH